MGFEGLPGEKIYVYEGSGVARPAGGMAPGTPMVATQGLAGKMVGGRLFSVAFETQSGHIGAMGGFTAIGLPAEGGFKVDLSAIPLGPPGTVARVLFACKDVRGFAGDYENQTWYFIPEGRIPNNIDSALTVDFYDADLQVEASYLLDQLDTIPAGVGINIYRGRLITWGEDANESVIRASKPGQPESFSEIEGFCTVNPGDAGGGVRYWFEYRTQLICCEP